MNAESQWIVTVTDTEISCTRPDGQTESVTWDELKAVVVHTTSEGPFTMDVFWLLAGEESGCFIPQGAKGEAALLERMQKLPGFDNEAFIEAMSSTEDDTFLCWRKDDA
ncbi:MAG: hypothetical protein WBV94_19440 [Blastocatellia bacterium]